MPACLKLLTKVAMTSAIEVHQTQSDLCLLKELLTQVPMYKSRSVCVCKEHTNLQALTNIQH